MSSASRSRQGLITITMSLAFLFAASTTTAAPRPGHRGGPKPGRGGRKPAIVKPKPPTGPGRKKHPAKVKGHPKVKRPAVKAPHRYGKHPWRAKRKYWHSRYAPKRTVYVATGYPYYVGGTTYTVSQPPVTVHETLVATPDPEASVSGQADDGGYLELLELTDMVHEWRTLNESAEFQKRVAAADEDEGSGTTQLLAKIQRTNQAFDRASRLAMQKAAAGQDAEAELTKARDALEDLVELADQLPEA